MTDDTPTAADLLPILRAGIRDGNYELGDNPAVMDAEDAMKDAADLIEAQAAEIERLRDENARIWQELALATRAMAEASGLNKKGPGD